MKPVLTLAACAALLCPAVTTAQSVNELTAAREQARAAGAAYRAQDWQTSAARLTEALKVQGHHPIWLYNLACAAVLRGDAAQALMLLDTLAELGFSFDAEHDSDFAALRASGEFRTRVAALAANRARIGRSEPAATLPGAAFLPEDVAYDVARHALYISSAHERKIVRIANGVATTLADSTAGLWSVLGIAYARRSSSIWAVTTVMREMAGYTAGATGSALVELDALSGAVRRRLIAPGTHHSFNDLALDDETGVVYVSDPGTSSILEWSERKGWRELVPPGHIFNPSGLTVMPKTDWLYVADYSVGLVRVSRASGQAERVREARGINTYGSDGLAHYRGDLVIIQNAVQPHRVARLKLDSSGLRVVKLEILERSSPYFDEPTLGVVAGDALLFVANSHWGKFRDGNYAGPNDAPGPIVLRLPLQR
jgi:hypothetical protein